MYLLVETFKLCKPSNEDSNCINVCCYGTFQFGTKFLTDVASSIIGYTVLESCTVNFLGTVSVTQVAQAAAVGSGISMGVTCCLLPCIIACSSKDDDELNPIKAVICGPVLDEIDNIPTLLIGAQALGYFANQTTTSAVIAGTAATGTAVFSGGCSVLFIVVFGGGAYCKDKYDQNYRYSYSTGPSVCDRTYKVICCPCITTKDVCVQVCTPEQFKQLLTYFNCCKKAATTAGDVTQPSSAPAQQPEMDRGETINIRDIPVAQTVDETGHVVGMALDTPLDETNQQGASAKLPSAPLQQEMDREVNKLAMG